MICGQTVVTYGSIGVTPERPFCENVPELSAGSPLHGLVIKDTYAACDSSACWPQPLTNEPDLREQAFCVRFAAAFLSFEDLAPFGWRDDPPELCVSVALGGNRLCRRASWSEQRDLTSLGCVK